MARYPVKDVHIASGFLPKNRPNHFGLDLADAPHTAVGAPEDMSVVRVWGKGTDGDRADNTRADAPFDGYGPAGILAKGKSGVFHLLAHLDPQGWDVDADSKDAHGVLATLDNPTGEIAPPTVGETFLEGQQVGRMPSHVGASGSHTHWEVRIEPIDNPTTRALNTYDPTQWVEHGGDTSQIARVLTISASPDKGIPWWVWAIGLYFLSKKR